MEFKSYLTLDCNLFSKLWSHLVLNGWLPAWWMTNSYQMIMQCQSHIWCLVSTNRDAQIETSQQDSAAQLVTVAISVFLCVVCGKKATKSACTKLGGCSSGSRAGHLLMARLVVWALTAPVFGQHIERLVALWWVHQGMNVVNL